MVTPILLLVRMSIFFAYLLPSNSKDLEIQGKLGLVKNKPSLSSRSCDGFNRTKKLQNQYNPKIAMGGKILENAISGGSLSTLEFRPFLAKNKPFCEDWYKLGTLNQVKGGYP